MSKALFKQGKHGITCLALPSSLFVIDLTVHVDISPNPGPDTQHINSLIYKETEDRHLPLKSRLTCYTRLELFSLKPSAPKRLPYLLALQLKDCALIRTRGNRAGIRVRKHNEREENSANQHRKIEIVKSRRPCQVLNQYDRKHKSTQVCYRPGLVPVKIVGRGPTIPKYVPVCMVINARSLAKVDAVPALFAELKHNNVDICIVSETWLNGTIPYQTT